MANTPMIVTPDSPQLAEIEHNLELLLAKLRAILAKRWDPTNGSPNYPATEEPRQ